MLYFLDMSVGTRIRQLRKEKGLTQRELANASDLHFSVINRYEANQAVPNGQSLKRLSEVLDVSSDYLLFDDAPRTGRVAIKDSDLYQKFLLIDRLTYEDRNAIRILLEAMIVKAKLEDLLPVKKDPPL